VRAMLDSKGAPLDVIEPEKRAKKGSKYGNSGTLCAAHCSIEENPTFSDVSVTVGISLGLLSVVRTSVLRSRRWYVVVLVSISVSSVGVELVSCTRFEC
jgi:hypothetical protein